MVRVHDNGHQDQGSWKNNTVKRFLRDHSKIGNIKVLKTGGSLMQVKSILLKKSKDKHIRFPFV